MRLAVHSPRSPGACAAPRRPLKTPTRVVRLSEEAQTVRCASPRARRPAARAPAQQRVTRLTEVEPWTLQPLVSRPRAAKRCRGGAKVDHEALAFDVLQGLPAQASGVPSANVLQQSEGAGATAAAWAAPIALRFIWTQRNIPTPMCALLCTCMRPQLLIGGEWRAASDGATMPVIDPRNEEVIFEAAAATAADVDTAVAAARRAFDGGAWPRMSAKVRAHARKIAGSARGVSHAALGAPARNKTSRARGTSPTRIPTRHAPHHAGARPRAVPHR